jgi:hypothetical protein
MKKNLLKKFSAFIIPIAIGNTTIFSSSANAQIIYTDLNPNVLLSCDFSNPCSGDYSLDLNNDGINDFVLSARKKFVGCGVCGGQLVYAMANGDSAVIATTAYSWIADKQGGYPINTLIDSSLGWTNAVHTLVTKEVNCLSCAPSQGSHLVHSNASGTWLNVYGKYLALKIKVGTNIYYGWVRLAASIGANTVSMTIMDYAYNTIANQPILAGQAVATGIDPLSFGDGLGVRLFPNPAKDYLTIELPNTNKEVEVTIADITGKMIYRTIVSDIQKLDVNTQDFGTGIYVVQIQSADFIATKKLVIER